MCAEGGEQEIGSETVALIVFGCCMYSHDLFCFVPR